MSAITGLFYRDDRPVEISWLHAMSAALAHRGSDARREWIEGGIGLGHRLLVTTKESIHDKLPQTSRTGDLVITADARIDNRQELLKALGVYISGGETVGDSSLILAAYQKWGEECPEKMIGDFAFAIWNRRTREFFCARDGMGVKPFYYFLSDRLFAFASEMKALLLVPGIESTLNEERLGGVVMGLFEESTSTLYRDIKRLAPGHSLSVGRESSRVKRYWFLDPDIEIRLNSGSEYAEKFREIFTEAVKCRVRSALPVGSSLSGGLDSSSIACTARDLVPVGSLLQTYSAVFPDLPAEDLKKIDEREYVESVLARGGFDPYFVRADQRGPMTALDLMLEHQGEAFQVPNLYIHWAMYSAAAANGVRVFLDGVDGDTTVSHGLNYLSELTRRGRFIKLWREARLLSRRSPRASATPAQIAWNYGLSPCLPAGLKQAISRVREKRSNPDIIKLMAVNPDFAIKQNLRQRAADQLRIQTFSSVREQHLESFNSPMIPYTLEVADRASAAFGIEARYPYFDRRLIEYCVALPAEQKLQDGWTRIVMRRAMEGVLPEKVRWRATKANLGPNFQRRLLEDGRSAIEDLFERTSDPISAYFDLNGLREKYRRYEAQPARSTSEARILYSAIVLSRWLNQCVASEPARPMTAAAKN